MASTGDTWRLGQRPALDGLRGVAVLLVVISHVSYVRFRPLGWTGVVVFFVLSGFLITALLLEESARDGRVHLRGFYLRRIRRLAPALLVLIAVVAVIAPHDPMLLTALTYTSNFRLAHGASLDSPLAHTWSLAIEEQFYMVWPLLLLVLRRFRREVQAAIVAVAIAAIWVHRVQVGAGDWNRVYYATDVRADGLLIGCLLAIVLHGRRATAPLRAWAWFGMGMVMLVGIGKPTPFMGVIMPGVVAVATAVVVWVSVTQPVGWLAWKPLVYLGKRSYGLYLCHPPIFLLLTTLLNSPPWWWVAVVGIPISLLVTEISWRFIEEPWLRGQDLHRHGRIAATDSHRHGSGGAVRAGRELVRVRSARG